jgi:hypothetical protein
MGFAFVAGFIAYMLADTYGWLGSDGPDRSTDLRAKIDRVSTDLDQVNRNLANLKCILDDIEQRAAGYCPAVH